MLKISLRLKKLHGTSQVNNLRILRIKNAKFSAIAFIWYNHKGEFSNLY